MNKEEISERLKVVRNDQGLSQQEMADQIGISVRAYQSYEQRERELSVVAVDGLFRAFGINPLWLLHGEDGGPRSMLSLDALAGLMVDLHKAFEKPIAHAVQPTSYGERSVAWSYLVRDTLIRGAVDKDAVERMHKVILTS